MRSPSMSSLEPTVSKKILVPFTFANIFTSAQSAANADFAVGRIDQDARIENAGGIKRLLGAGECRAKKRRRLHFIARAMIAADRVVMRHRPALRHHDLVGRAFDLTPLRQSVRKSPVGRT